MKVVRNHSHNLPKYEWHTSNLPSYTGSHIVSLLICPSPSLRAGPAVNSLKPLPGRIRWTEDEVRPLLLGTGGCCVRPLLSWPCLLQAVSSNWRRHTGSGDLPEGTLGLAKVTTHSHHHPMLPDENKISPTRNNRKKKSQPPISGQSLHNWKDQLKIGNSNLHL